MEIPGPVPMTRVGPGQAGAGSRRAGADPGHLGPGQEKLAASTTGLEVARTLYCQSSITMFPGSWTRATTSVT
jgi:hypothetical protein